MHDTQDPKWRKLTFSQREGYAPRPDLLKPGELPQKFRNRVWRYFDKYKDRCESFYCTFLMEVEEMPHDEIYKAYHYYSDLLIFIRHRILESEPHETLTFIEFALRSSDCPDSLVNQIRGEFKHVPNYFIDDSAEPVCIVPCSSEEAKAHIQQLLFRINESELTGAKQHFAKAAQALNKKDYSDAIRESIHAVESAAKEINVSASETLTPALNSLSTKMYIHTTLKEAFQKLYSYTNKEKGIRHGLVDQDQAKVGLDEALFMYGACVSFVDYLRSKKQQLDEK